MFVKILLVATVALGFGSGLASAQTAAPATGHKVVRSSVLGTKGKQASGTPSSAEAEAKADKQPSGTENGNQPDRAAAGGGAR